MSEKEEALESFKTQNAVLKNSVRYLPVAVDESGDNLVSTDLKLRLTNLIRDTLHYNRDAKTARQQNSEAIAGILIATRHHVGLPPT
ncbi:hypothetical protein C2W62_35660 [Candidatus Entotheonella serta]|nr:hypothetical protein C2W62_35660 [Candidatus Entotheonella serta]